MSVKAPTRYRVAGAAVPRTDYRRRVTGSEEFASDFRVDGMAEGAVVRSPYAHAQVIRIDCAAALALPGVICVLTPDDLADIDPYFGPVYRDQPILAMGRVRFEGEPVAAVAAVDRATALEAARLVDVTYEPLPVADSLESALAPGAPQLHTEVRRGRHYSRVLAAAAPLPAPNVAAVWSHQRGDAAGAMAGADVVVAGEYRVPIIHQVPLEPIHVVARVDAAGLAVWSGTQTPFQVRQELAAIFSLPQSRVRVVALSMGGSFGAKAFPKLEPLAAALARKAGRAVRIALSMPDTARTIRRAGARIRIESGLRRDGTLVARRVEVDFQIGAYADAGPRVAQKGAYVSAGPYRVPHLELRSRAVYTNTPPSGAYRGFGTPQVTWAYEQHTDEIAEGLGLDPIAFRLKNLLRRGELYAEGDTPIDTDFGDVLRRLAADIGWGEPLPPWRGRGVAVSFKASQAPTESSALVRLHADGSASVFCATAEMGQGATSVLAQVAAEELGLPLADVIVHTPDTALAPFDQTTTSSRSTVAMGRAVQAAAGQLRAQLLARAGRLLEVPADDLTVVDGEVRGAGAVSIAEVLARTADVPGAELIALGHFAIPAGKAPVGGATPFWEPCWTAAEVEVDPDTGQVRILRLLSALDAGLAINPLQVEAQDLGSAMQGIGAALYEEMAFADGVLLNASLIDYRVPLVGDLPGEFRSYVIENGDGPGPFGSKGVGEGGLMAAPAAIGNAVARAIGARIRDLPLKPERVWAAIAARGEHT